MDKKKILLISIVSFIIVSLLAIGIPLVILLKTQNKDKKKTPPTPPPTPKPPPKPKPHNYDWLQGPVPKECNIPENCGKKFPRKTICYDKSDKKEVETNFCKPPKPEYTALCPECCKDVKYVKTISDASRLKDEYNCKWIKGCPNTSWGNCFKCCKKV